jgi:hypothetical protein
LLLGVGAALVVAELFQLPRKIWTEFGKMLVAREPTVKAVRQSRLKGIKIPWFVYARSILDILLGSGLMLFSITSASGVRELPYIYTDDPNRFLLVQSYFMLLLAISFLLVLVGIISIVKADTGSISNVVVAGLLMLGAFFLPGIGGLVSQVGSGDYMASGFVLAMMAARYFVAGLIVLAFSIPAAIWVRRLSGALDRSRIPAKQDQRQGSVGLF